MRDFTTSRIIDAPLAQVWEVMADVEHWADWTPSILGIDILSTGEFGVGSQVKIRQPKLPPALWTVTEFVPQSHLIWISRGPGLLVTGEHLLVPTENGTRLTLNLHYGGALGGFLGWLFRDMNQPYIEMEASGLKTYCENRAAQQ